MTAQVSESLIVNGVRHALCSEPLSDYFKLSGVESPFVSFSTANWRGYQGTWELINDRLYLVKLHGCAALGDGELGEVNLSFLFPSFPDRVFAHWFSGEIRCPEGGLLNYVHGGYASTYERDVYYEIVDGVVVSTRTVNNGVAEEDAPQGYRVGASLTFPPSRSK